MIKLFKNFEEGNNFFKFHLAEIKPDLEIPMKIQEILAN